MTEEQQSLNLVLDKLEALDTRLAKMEKYLERQKGFFGGIVLVTGIVAWVVAEVKDWWK